ncbi:MAG: SHD1 domain-containing protein [Pirellulaceae bacterium]
MGGRHRRAGWVLLLGLVWCAAASEAVAQQRPLRNWSSADGQYKTEARFVAVKDGGVVLEKAEGGRITVPLARLSDDDRRFIALMKATSTPTDVAAPSETVGASAGGAARKPASFATVEEEIAARLTTEAATEYRLVREIHAHGGPVESVAFSADGRRLISTSKADDCCVWDAATGLRISRCEQPLFGAWYTAALSADGKLGAFSGTFKKIHLFDADTGKLIRSYDAEATVSHLAFSRDGKWLLAADWGGNAMRLAIEGDGHTVHNVENGRMKPFQIFAAAPSGDLMVLGDKNHREGQQLVVFAPTPGMAKMLPIGGSSTVDVASGGEQLFFGGFHGDCKLDTVALQAEGAARAPRKTAVFDAHFLGLDRVAISHDGERYAAFCIRNGEAVFGEADYQEIPCRTSVKLPVIFADLLEFGPDLLTVALRGVDGTISLWKLDELPRTREARLAGLARDWLVAEEYDKLEALEKWLLANPGLIRYRSAAEQQGLLVTCLGMHWSGEITDHQPRLKRWTEARPESTLARLALARYYELLAWFIRGGGFANSVPEESMRHFGQLTQKSYETLLPLLEKREAPASAYQTVFNTAMAHSWDEEQYGPHVEQLLRIEPGYHEAHSVMVLKLLPRWGGEKGDSERYAKRAADHLGGGAGDALYAKLAASARLYFRAPEFFDYTDFDYDRIQRGLAHQQKTWPRDPWAFYEALVFAKVTDDKEIGKRAYDGLMALDDKHPIWMHDGGLKDPMFDTITRVYYEQARRWGKSTFPREMPARLPYPSPPQPGLRLTLGPYQPAEGDSAAVAVAPKTWDAPESPQFMKFHAVLEKRREAMVNTFAFSPDSSRLAAGHADGSTSIWPLSDLANKAALPSVGTRGVTGVAWLPDGGSLIASTGDGKLLHWQGPDEHRVLWSESGKFTDVAISPDGRLLTASCEDFVRAWDLPDMRPQRVVLGRGAEQLAFSADGGAVLLLDAELPAVELLREGGAPSPVKLPEAPLSAAAWSPDGALVALAPRQGDVQVVETASGRVLQQLNLGAPVVSLAFLPDSRTLAAAAGHYAQLCDAPTGEVHQKQKLGASLTGLAVSPNGKALALRSHLAFSVWAISTDRPTEAFDAPPPQLAASSASPQRPRRPAPPHPEPPPPGQRPLSDDVSTPPFELPPLPADAVDATTANIRWERYGMIATPERGYFAVSAQQKFAWSCRGIVHLFDLATGEQLWSRRFGERTVQNLAFAADGAMLVGSMEKTLAVANVETGDMLATRTFDDCKSNFHTVVASPQGNVLIAGTSRDALVVKLPSLELLQELDVGEDSIVLSDSGIAISSDGRRGAVAAADRKKHRSAIAVYDLAEGELSSTVPGGKAFGFQPEGRLLIAAMGRAGLVDLASKDYDSPFKEPLRAATIWYEPARFQLFAGDQTGLVIVWDLATGEKQTAVRPFEKRIEELKFLPDGKGFVTLSMPMGLQFWAAKKAK